MAEQDVPKDWFEFMQKMWNPTSFPMPGMITPTANVEEIEKKIAEFGAKAKDGERARASMRRWKC